MNRRIPASAAVASLLLIVTAVSAALASGAATAEPPAPIADPGPLVTAGLPAVKAAMNVAAATTLGGLLLASVALPRTSEAWSLALDISAIGATLWAIIAAAAATLSFLDIAGSVDITTLAASLGYFLTNIAIGQAWLATILCAAVLCILCLAVRNHAAVGAVTIGGFLALAPMTLQGHAAGAGNHTIASTALFLHSAAAAAWIGGLLALLLVRGRVAPDSLRNVLERYSTLALASFVVLAIGGVVGALLRLGAPSDLFTTDYGLLLSAKILLLGLLGVFGAYYRTRVLRPSLIGPVRVVMWKLATVELGVMGTAVGLAATLARTAPPIPERIAVTPAERLTGQPLPPPFSVARAFDQWAIDPLWIVAALFGAVLYLGGVRRLRNSGEPWPILRTVLWLSGMLLLLFLTNGAPRVYAPYAFSANAFIATMMAFLVPLLMVASAPLTLAVHAIRARGDTSRGGREWLLLVLRSRGWRLLTEPVVAATLLIAVVIAYHLTELSEWSLEDPVGQQSRAVLLLASGALLSQSLIGSYLGRPRLNFAGRLAAVAVITGFVVGLGAWLFTSEQLLLPDWYGVISEGWSERPIVNQQSASASVWGIGLAYAATTALVIVRDARRVWLEPHAGDKTYIASPPEWPADASD